MTASADCYCSGSYFLNKRRGGTGCCSVFLPDGCAFFNNDKGEYRRNTQTIYNVTPSTRSQLSGPKNNPQWKPLSLVYLKGLSPRSRGSAWVGGSVSSEKSQVQMVPLLCQNLCGQSERRQEQKVALSRCTLHDERSRCRARM